MSEIGIRVRCDGYHEKPGIQTCMQREHNARHEMYFELQSMFAHLDGKTDSGWFAQTILIFRVQRKCLKIHKTRRYSHSK